MAIKAIIVAALSVALAFLAWGHGAIGLAVWSFVVAIVCSVIAYRDIAERREEDRAIIEDRLSRI